MKSSIINALIIAALAGYLLYSGKYQLITGALRYRLAPAKKTGVEWIEDYDEALLRARALKRPLFVLITAPSWCLPCQALDQSTLQNDELQSLLNGRFVTLRLDDTNPDRRHFNFRAYPTILLLSDEGQEQRRFSGFVGAPELIRSIGKTGID